MPFIYSVDPTYLLVILGLIIGMIAQAGVQSAYKKYSQVRSSAGFTGAEAARRILDQNGLYDVPIEMARGGSLSDHYDPRHRVLRLSPEVYSSPSLAALGIAAHEVGHAIQHKEEYRPLALRSTLVPAANIGSSLAWPIFILGLIFSLDWLLVAGIAAFTLAVIFQVVTLPVEFNASKRAMDQLDSGRYLTREEQAGVKKVLRSAAMTYVAAALASILQLARLLMLSGRRRRR